MSLVLTGTSGASNLDSTNGLQFATWTTSTRPASPIAGQMGYNTTTNAFDAYVNGAWVSVATTSQVIGVSQTWQDVTSSRVAGTTYTNSTGKPIMVVGKLTSSASAIATITVDSVVVPGSGNAGTSGFWMTASAIVPNGSTYIYTVNTGTPTLVSAVELR